MSGKPSLFDDADLPPADKIAHIRKGLESAAVAMRGLRVSPKIIAVLTRVEEYLVEVEHDLRTESEEP